MNHMEASLKVQTFFVMDENFPLHRARAMQLLAPHEGSAVFASANAIQKYTPQELVELGISWLWMGLESPHSHFTKLQGTDTRQLTGELREHGIRVQGSTIIGLEHHTRENIAAEINYAVDHRTNFHQFMLYTPVPGTPLYQEMSDQGRMLENVDFADIHGQDKFNFRHSALSREDSKRFLDWAFRRDFEQNGPSLYRMCRTMLQGWLRYKGRSGRARWGTIRPRVGKIAHGLLRRPLAHGEAVRAGESERQRGDSCREERRLAPATLTNRPLFSSAATGRRLRLSETREVG
jgi:hypothetical protein